MSAKSLKESPEAILRFLALSNSLRGEWIQKHWSFVGGSSYLLVLLAKDSY